MLRVLLGVNVLALLAALVQSNDLLNWYGRYVEMAAAVEPCLLISLGLLALLRDVIRRLPIRFGQLTVFAACRPGGRCFVIGLAIAGAE